MRSWTLVFLMGPISLSSLGYSVETTTTARRNPVQTYAELMVTSSYVSRGRTVHKSPAVQPMVRTRYKALSVGAWASQALETQPEQQNQEVDLFADYDLAFEPVSFTLGTIQGYYPETEAPVDQEVYLKGYFNLPLRPRFSINRGVAGAPLNYMYYELGAKQDLYNQGNFASSLSAALGYSDRPSAPDGLRHLTLTAAASWQYLAASANYVFETNKKVNDLSNQEPFYVQTAAGFTF